MVARMGLDSALLPEFHEDVAVRGGAECCPPPSRCPSVFSSAESCRCAHGRTNDPRFGALPAILLDWTGSPSLPLRERGLAQEQLEQERSYSSSRGKFKKEKKKQS